MEVKDIVNTEIFKGRIKFDEPMSAHTSLRIGGSADVMVFPEDTLSLKNVLISAKMQNIPVFILGGGTNLLVRDKGVRGIVISLRELKRIEVVQKLEQNTDGSATVFAEAGAPLQRLINFTKFKGYSGIEALAGIPGTVGGATYMNAGSFGREIKDVIISVVVMNMNGEIIILNKDQLNFSYRSSNISQDLIILSIDILLRKDSPENVVKCIKEFLGKKILTQPLKERSAGCVFKNPEGNHAGRLIDVAGCKGMRAGDVEVSRLHANYFINKGRASGSDFLKLMDIVRTKVKEQSGVTLEPEIKIIGEGI